MTIEKDHCDSYTPAVLKSPDVCCLREIDFFPVFYCLFRRDSCSVKRFNFINDKCNITCFVFSCKNFIFFTMFSASNSSSSFDFCVSRGDLPNQRKGKVIFGVITDTAVANILGCLEETFLI